MLCFSRIPVFATTIRKVATLAASPCSDHFNWSHTKNLAVTRNISVLKCGFKETDNVLKLIETSLDSDSVDAEECQEYATPILCHYIYQDCDVQPLRPTAQDCTRVQNDFCKGLWKTVADYINLLPQLGKCLAMPNCSRDFSNSSTSVLFSGLAIKSINGHPTCYIAPDQARSSKIQR